MAKESKSLRIPKLQGEKTLILAYKLRLLDKNLEIDRDEKTLYIPLIDEPEENILRTLKKERINFRLTTHLFQERKRKTTLIETLEPILPPHLLASLPHAVDLVGDIAIIEIPPGLDAYKQTIGQAILKANKNVRTVLAKASSVTGTYRLREFNFIAGEQKTETVHKEFGCKYKVDVTKAYFSPRLSHEHRRIASLVKEGETTVDMFAGVGPFAILIAKMHQNVQAYAIDANPHAFEYLKTNIRLNRVIGKVQAFYGDAKQVIKDRIPGIADRVIMNLPEKSMQYVGAACNALSVKGGTIHFYCFLTGSKSLESVKLDFKQAVEKSGRKLRAVTSRIVRETAPHEWQAVLDATID